MGVKSNRRSAQQQCNLVKRVKKVNANHSFNLFTNLRMLGTIEAQICRNI